MDIPEKLFMRKERIYNHPWHNGIVVGTEKCFPDDIEYIRVDKAMEGPCTQCGIRSMGRNHKELTDMGDLLFKTTSNTKCDCNWDFVTGESPNYFCGKCGQPMRS